MTEIPPFSVIVRLPISTLIKLTRMAIVAVIRRNCLEHTLADLIEEMDYDDVMLIKHQLDRSEGILKHIIEKRIRWGDWPTAPVVKAEPYSPYVDGKFVP